jgi:PAS domain S-box-containing protein
MTYKLQDLIDIEQFQYLQDRLNEIYSFPSAIIDNEGNILTATAWQDVCTHFHRKNKECERDCLHSDQYILSHLHEANPAVSYRCPRGLVDNATPIIIDGVHYGNYFTGQFFLEKPDLDFFKEQAKAFGFNETAYLEAVKRVPIWSKEQLNSYLYFIKGLIVIISESGLKKMKDIESRKQAENSEERANTILRQMNDGFWITNAQGGQIIDVNDAMCRMLGYSREEMLKMTVADVEAIDTPADIARRIQAIIQMGTTSFESRFRRKNRTLVDLDISITYLPNRHMFFGFHRDISERKQTEEKILANQTELQQLLARTELSRQSLLSVIEDQKEAEEKIQRLNAELEQRVIERTAQISIANQELEAFSYSVSHDLRAPLRALSGFSEILLSDYLDQLDEQGKVYLTQIKKAAQRMGQLIEDLLNLSRITRTEINLTQVDLSSTARQIAEELQAQAPDRQVIFDISPNLVVQADANLIKIALDNMLRNAFKFTNKRKPAHIHFGMLAQNGASVYFVRDNGAGFNMAYANKLFTPFQRLHGAQEYPGSGIGLTIVQRIITRHAGRIWTEAVEDQGATFYFTLGSS